MDFDDGFSKIFGLVKECGDLIQESINDFDNGLEVQNLKLNKIYDNLLQSAQTSLHYVQEKKISTKISKANSCHSLIEGDLFSTASTSDQRKHKVQSPNLNVPNGKVKYIPKSTTANSCSGITITSNKPKPIIDTTKSIKKYATTSSGIPKKAVCTEYNTSPKMGSSKNRTNIKPNDFNITYDIAKILTPIKENKPMKFDKTIGITPTSEKSLIGVYNNFAEHITLSSDPVGVKKKRLQKEKKTDAMKIDAACVLENSIPTPLRTINNILKTNEVSKNEARKKKELCLKFNANQKKIREHLDAAKQRNQTIKHIQQKYENIAENEKKLLKNVKIVSKHKQSEKSKELNMKNEQFKTNNDYGINDVSVNDSSDDELKPKYNVPCWAKRENRIGTYLMQSCVDSKERDLFFNCPKSLNFKEMFKGYNANDKQRTSSAVWNSPSRLESH